MDKLTRSIQDEVPWCMLFVDDIILIDETRDGVNGRLEVVQRIQVEQDQNIIIGVQIQQCITWSRQSKTCLLDSEMGTLIMMFT